MSCGVGRSRGSDPKLLWPWHSPVAIAPIRPLAWEPSYGTGVTLKRSKQNKTKKKPETKNPNKQKEKRVYKILA